MALFNPKTHILIQIRHPYTGNLNSEMPGDSKNAFLHWGDVSALKNMAKFDYLIPGARETSMP